MKYLLLFTFLIGLSTTTKASGLDSIPLLIPAGLHEVGNTSYTVKEGERELVIKFWYPTDILSDKKKAAPILDKTHFSSLLNKQSSTALWKRNAKDIKRAILNEEDLGYPVMVFFAEFGMDRVLNNALYQKLASNGFVVVSIDLPDLVISISMV